ncbi:helix-turn-helix domain-containing protein [Caballeronia sp. SBC2]|uniref:helix-turn-helix domain-containing protein n=1 Tax=Caballeronia sp. SBC2 TaxID=2705547 RepID=UPI0013E1DF4A|nr:helix-turn-helix transcriptional regulator [Caballeronia sp. SBC2]QIE22859.1 helix-turn-helix protein [Caballeronia sp. SBC2]
MVKKNENALYQIAHRVQELRVVGGLSQDEFARLVGCHRSQVSQVERGVKNLSLDTIDRFAKALGVDAVSLLQSGPVVVHESSNPLSLRERVSRNVFTLRSARGFAQDALSESAGLSRNYVSSLEVRKKNVALSHLELLAAALGVPLTALLAPPKSDSVASPS